MINHIIFGYAELHKYFVPLASDLTQLNIIFIALRMSVFHSIFNFNFNLTYQLKKKINIKTCRIIKFVLILLICKSYLY